MEWKKLDLTDEKIKGGMYYSQIFISDREYLKITNKLVKRLPDGHAYLLYKDGFTFDLYRIEYGRYGKRFDEFSRTVESSELEKLFCEYVEEEITLPKVTGKPRDDLLDD